MNTETRTRRQFLSRGLLGGACLLSGGLSSWSTAEQAKRQQGSDGLLRIASHNIYWGQGSRFKTDQPPAPRLEVLRGLTKIYRDYGADIVSLQEIQSDEAAQAMAAELEMNYLYQAGGDFPQYGGAVFSRWPLRRLPLDAGKPARIIIPVEVAVEGKKAFRIVDVHLPSNRQLGPQKGAEKRLEDIGLAAGHGDLIIGDFNQRETANHAALLQERGYSLVWSDQEYDAMAYSKGAGVIDQAWIRKEYRDRVQDFSYFRTPRIPDSSDGGTLSDHPGILMAIRWEW